MKHHQDTGYTTKDFGGVAPTIQQPAFALPWPPSDSPATTRGGFWILYIWGQASIKTVNKAG